MQICPKYPKHSQYRAKVAAQQQLTQSTSGLATLSTLTQSQPSQPQPQSTPHQPTPTQLQNSLCDESMDETGDVIIVEGLNLLEASPRSMPPQGVTSKSLTLLQQNLLDLLRSTPRPELETTEETSDNDPDYSLEQYHMRRVTSPSGFVHYLNERDIMDVPVHKREKVQALLEAERLAYLASQDSESSEDEDCGGPMTQRTSMALPLGPTL